MKHIYSHDRYGSEYGAVHTTTSTNKHGKYNVNRDRSMSQDEGKTRPKTSYAAGRRERKDSSETSLAPETSYRRSSSSLLLQKERKRAKSLDDDIQRWNMRNATLCESSQWKTSVVDETVPPIVEIESVSPSADPITPREPSSQLSQYNRIFSNVKTHSYHDKAKENMVKQVVNMRLENGDNVMQLAKEPFFEDILDICDSNHLCPAYKEGVDMTFEDYRSLRKCRYLRLSEKNIASLKEATLSLLNDEKD